MEIDYYSNLKKKVAILFFKFLPCFLKNRLNVIMVCSLFAVSLYIFFYARAKLLK